MNLLDNLRWPDDPSPLDWTEDFKHESGAYHCRCGLCGQMFIGLKRRTLCKPCHRDYAASDRLKVVK